MIINIEKHELSPENVKDYINEKVIVIPEGVTGIDDETFKDFTNLEEIVLPDSLQWIGANAFNGCTSLKNIKFPNTHFQILPNAFSDCTSLTEVTMPKYFSHFPDGIFSGCTNLRKVNCSDQIHYIGVNAFKNCHSLEELPISPTTSSIGFCAFYGCDSIKEIQIPETTTAIDHGAFAMMKSLEKITVDQKNPVYCSDKGILLIDKTQGILVQYVPNALYTEFKIDYYDDDISIETDDEPIITQGTIYTIGDFAFAGAKNLRKISIPSEISAFHANSFYECDNLTDLEIYYSTCGSSLSISLPQIEIGKYDPPIPFKNIKIGDGIKFIFRGNEHLFKNAISIKLPKDLEIIHDGAFSLSKTKRFVIPSSIKTININAFPNNSKISFPIFKDDISSDFFKSLNTYTENNFTDGEDVQVYSFVDGNYCIKIDDNKFVEISDEDINNIEGSDRPEFNYDGKRFIFKPEYLVSYLISLVKYNFNNHDKVSRMIKYDEVKNLFEKLAYDEKYIEMIKSNEFNKIIRDILNCEGIYDEFIMNGSLLHDFGKCGIFTIFDNYSNSLVKMIKSGKIGPWVSSNKRFNFNKMINYCNLLERYNLTSGILINPNIFMYLPSISDTLGEDKENDFLSHFNANMKHILNNSDVLISDSSNNIIDLYKLLKITGAFEDDEIISQRAMTFLNDNMFNPDPNKQDKISGNMIHSMFSDLRLREKIDYDFITFFMENYDELIKCEKENPGFICKTYNLFPEIKATSTSHRGSQRQLKVTVKKCADFFLLNHFEGVTEENKKLANFLTKYFSEPFALKIALNILETSKEAPRNIFSKIDFDDDNPICSYDEIEDLKEEYGSSDFTYEWLPKQSWDNFVLGKKCSCCAHLLGQGAGIMCASMISPNCQNLVIRNKDGEIIAKMTLYINRDEGYGVFNTAEVNSEYHDDESLKGIYKAFVRGCKAFIEAYNLNNDVAIDAVTIGARRNAIQKVANFNVSDTHEAINYSDFGYQYKDKDKGYTLYYGTYNGDSKEQQLLVYKKDIR